MLGHGDGKQLKAYVRYSAVGLELALSVVAGIVGGVWLDGKFKTEPVFILLGLFVGVFAGFRSLIRAARQAAKESKESDE